MKYDYLIVGAGFFGATFARLATDDGKKCLVIDSRPHIAGNAYTERKYGIDIHKYGPHIFHTNDDNIWKFVNKFTKFNNFIYSPKSYFNDKIYSLPFNMNTFYEIWGCITPDYAKSIIESQKYKGEPTNLEEQALSLVGKDVYELLIKGYTEKQWMKDPKELPPDIIKRLPVRFTYDNNYFNDKYQGIPIDGYTKLFENILDGIEVQLNTNYFENKDYFDSLATNVVFTGKIDEYYNYEFGELDYRSLNFEHKELDVENFQGMAVMNYASSSVPWTRTIEHKHFTFAKSDKTIITYEEPIKYTKNEVPYYPINDDKNQKKYNKYRDKSELQSKVIFGGRLSEYRYYDMHQVIASAHQKYKKHK